MSAYRLDVPKEVRRQVDALPGRYRQRFRRLINDLADNPRPAGARQLRTGENRYRIRVDDYRLVYRVFDDVLLVEVLKAGQKAGPEFYEDVD